MDDFKRKFEEIVKNNKFLKNNYEFTLYKRGKSIIYIFKINGEVRNIEKYLSPGELAKYKELTKKEASISNPS